MSPEAGSGPADRELRAEAVVAAPPARVWRLLSDVSHMGEWSPELVRMIPMKPGGLRKGQWYLGINKRKGVVWTTRSVVAVLEPERALAWDVRTNGTRWVWEIRPEGEGTRVIHRRPVPEGISWLGNAFARVFLGGINEHADELEQGMARTVSRLKAAAES